MSIYTLLLHTICFDITTFQIYQLQFTICECIKYKWQFLNIMTTNKNHTGKAIFIHGVIIVTDVDERQPPHFDSGLY